MIEGFPDGSDDGSADGAAEGLDDGLERGIDVGRRVGVPDGISVGSPDERVQSGNVEISSREHEEPLKTKANNCIFACRKHLRACMQDFVTFPMVLVDRRTACLNLLVF